jgi:5'-nucleotidase
MNGGGIRADLPKGPLSYGALYMVMPFDNRFAVVKQSGKATRQMFERNLASNGGILSVAGARVDAQCKGGKLDVEIYLRDRSGAERKLEDAVAITIVTNDFLATGGDSILKEHEVTVQQDAPLIREALAARLKAKPPSLDPATWLDPASPRLRLPGKRPIRCQ